MLASDGIFEVLENNQIDSTILSVYHENKFEISAGIVVDKAVGQWRAESNGQDDITTIIVFFEV